MKMTPSIRVLVIDDDVELCELLTEYLQPEMFEVDSVHDGREGLDRVERGDYSLVVLDVMLPSLNGFEVLRRVRNRSEVPVLMLTARGDEVDRIVGLEIGADDYLPKPFNPRELVARIRAILRRAEREVTSSLAQDPLDKISVGDLTLDMGTRTVRQTGKLVRLTAVEFDLLLQLLRSAGRVVSRDDLCRKVLGRELSPLDRSVDMHVSQLRKKLGPRIGQAERIQSIRSVGYLYANTETEPERE